MNDADKAEKYLAVVRARQSVYELLSGFYLELPDQKMVNTIFDPDFRNRLSEVASVFETGEIHEGLRLISSFALSFQNESQEEMLRQIAIDRTRLFRGISKKHSPLPPYESCYREQRLCGESSAEVYKFYCKLGVALPEAWTESPDYLGIEIDFMRLLCRREEEAWMNNQPEKGLEFLRASIEFLKDHLLKWVPSFLEKMYQTTELDLYRGLAKLTSGFLKYDIHFVERQLKEIRNTEFFLGLY